MRMAWKRERAGVSVGGSGAGKGEGQGTHHGGARGQAQELGDQGVDVQAHDMRRLQQQGLQAAEGGELHHAVRAG